jgi:hypothetical protein
MSETVTKTKTRYGGFPNPDSLLFGGFWEMAGPVLFLKEKIMPENLRKDRIVRTGRGPGILYYQLETDGAQLITFDVNSETNEVTPQHSTKARYGHEYVEADESRQVLDDKTNALIDQQREAGITPVTDRPIRNEDNLQVETEQPTWQRLGFASKAEWRNAGKPEN